MPLVKEDVRNLASVVTVDELLPIEGSDNIVAARVKNWTLVVKKGEFSVGEKAVYFEEDSALPVDDPRYSFLFTRGVKTFEGADYHVLKIARIRGVYSQGLLLPLEQFEDQIYHWAVNEALASSTDPVWSPPVGMNLTEALGIMKWEGELEAKNGEAAGPFLTNYVSKTDAERVQNITNSTWEKLIKDEWIPTEKIDGTSMTVIRDRDGVVRVCSRNLELKDGDSIYWNVLRRYKLDTLVPEPFDVLQLEVAGPGVQGNRQNISMVRPYLFNVVKNRVVVPRAYWTPEQLEFSAPVLDLEFPKTPTEALEQVNGLKSTIDSSRLAEGVVWHSATGKEYNALGNRSVWKAVSQKYLTKG